MSNWLLLFPLLLHADVRAVQIVRRVRALSVWRESAPSAVQTARSAPALQPQPSPATHLANTPTGKVNGAKLENAQLLHHIQRDVCVTSLLPGRPLAVCQTTSRRAVVTQWTARLPQMPPAIATVLSQGNATWPTATRTASPVLRALPRRRSLESQPFVRLWCRRWGCKTTTTLVSAKHTATPVRLDALVTHKQLISSFFKSDWNWHNV